MKSLELFAGSRSFSKVAEDKGFTTFSSDWKAFEGIDLVCDILEFNPEDVPFVPDVIWASPPCTFFSVASIGKHWNKDNTPKTKEAEYGVKVAKSTKRIIEHFLSKNPNLKFYIENPRGKLRKLSIYDDFIRHTVTYCQYGDTRMKPTDIWTNDRRWSPRPMCKNGDPCHTAAPRGSSTGTQGLKDNYLRSIVPEDLCCEIVELNM